MSMIKKMIPWIALVILITGVSLGARTFTKVRAPSIIDATTTPQAVLGAAASAAAGTRIYIPIVDAGPAVTPTRTPNPTASLPTATPSKNPTSTPGVQPTASGNTSAFAIGPGGADVIPHQIVRTADDRLYVFGYKGDGSAQLNAYWTTAAGLPSAAANFNGSLQVTNDANILSIDAIYDGAHTIHVLTNDLKGQIKDRPFNTLTNAYLPVKTLAADGGTVVGYYVGTSGISGLFDKANTLHIVYWSSANHILYRSYTYAPASDSLNSVDGLAQLDTDGKSNHPVLAVSPLDGSVTVAWISEALKPARILVKSKVNDAWGAIMAVSTGAVWVSPNSGINIDNGPSLVISTDGKKHLAYIEDYGPVAGGFEYGKVHYVSDASGVWVDQYTGFYSHDPAVAVNSAGQIFIIGHGHPQNSGKTSMEDMYVYPRGSTGVWTAKLLIAHQTGQSFDSSPSVKWSVVGFTRPDVIEVLFSQVGAGYANSILYYARIQ